MPQTWTTPRTWSVGELVTAGLLNQQLRDNLNTLRVPLYCRVENRTNISVPNSTYVEITFDTETTKNDAAMHSTSSNTARLIAPVAGFYLIEGCIEWSGNPNGQRQFEIFYNGTTTIHRVAIPADTGINHCQNVMTTFYLNANDFITFRAFQNSGATLDVQWSSAYSATATFVWLGSA